MTSVAVVFQSEKGHTKVLADAVLKGVQSVSDVDGKVFEISGKDVQRGRFVNAAIMEALDACDGIVFGCATYMGSASARRSWKQHSAPIGWNSDGRTKLQRASRIQLPKVAISSVLCCN